MDQKQAATAVAAYVRTWAPAAGYDLDQRGRQAELARDANISASSLSLLLRGERLPLPAALWALCETIKRPYLEVAVLSGAIPSEAASQITRRPVTSGPITADALADDWGVTNEEDREYVRATLDRLRELIRREPRDVTQQRKAADG